METKNCFNIWLWGDYIMLLQRDSYKGEFNIRDNLL